MMDKTPVSLLHELCVQENEAPPMYVEDKVQNENNPRNSSFRVEVEAFDYHAVGFGQSKKLAKHEACSKLIAILQNTRRFRGQLTKLPVPPQQTFDDDSVIKLLDICIQRNWPLASFKVLQACGEPHKPLFTMLGQLASIKRTAVALTKKAAKQIVAQKLLKIVLEAQQQSENERQIVKLDSETETQSVKRTYREWKTSGTKHLEIPVSERHNHFMRLPQEDRNAAYDILCGDNAAKYNDSELVKSVCDQLNWKYKITPIPNHPQNFSTFELLGDYDVVLVNDIDKLYGKVVDYLKIMMNFSVPKYDS